MLPWNVGFSRNFRNKYNLEQFSADRKSFGMKFLLFHAKVWKGIEGREPGRTWGGRGTGDGIIKDGKRDHYEGGKRARNSKREAFVIFLQLMIHSKT